MVALDPVKLKIDINHHTQICDVLKHFPYTGQKASILRQTSLLTASLATYTMIMTFPHDYYWWKHRNRLKAGRVGLSVLLDTEAGKRPQEQTAQQLVSQRTMRQRRNYLLILLTCSVTLMVDLSVEQWFLEAGKLGKGAERVWITGTKGLKGRSVF